MIRVLCLRLSVIKAENAAVESEWSGKWSLESGGGE